MHQREDCSTGHLAPHAVPECRGLFPFPLDSIQSLPPAGPLTVLLPAYSHPCFLPRLTDLWSYQAGYRWNSLTGKLSADWPEEWLVIADQGADPFIFSRKTGVVQHDYHGSGKWQPKPIFPTVEAMITCLLVLGSVVPKPERDLTDKRGRIKETYRQQAIDRLRSLGQAPDLTEDGLKRLGWA